MRQDNLRSWFIIYLKGFAMGSADAVPGVSGGTIALIVGIYERLIKAVTSVNVENAKKSLKAVKKRDPNSINQIIHDIDGYFLAVLLTGVLSAIILILRVIHFLLNQYPVPTYGFFFGLIAVSVVVLRSEVSLEGYRNKLAAIIGFSLAVLTSGYAATSLGHTIPVIFLAGMFAVSAMILPGISGSLMLIILGQYEYISGALTEFTDALISFVKSGEIQPVTEASLPIAVFASGAVVGLFSIAHAVHKALENHRRTTLVFLVSLVAGALRAPLIEVEKVLAESGVSWISVLPEFSMAALAGGIAIFILDRRAGMI